MSAYADVVRWSRQAIGLNGLPVFNADECLTIASAQDPVRTALYVAWEKGRVEGLSQGAFESDDPEVNPFTTRGIYTSPPPRCICIAAMQSDPECEVHGPRQER